jgi:hypothetical protein
VAIQVNDNIAHYFQTKVALQQGDRLSSMLFNIVDDTIVFMIVRTKIYIQIKAVVLHIIDGGLSIL